MRLGTVRLYLAMLFLASDIWAVYGVGLAGREVLESNRDCTSCIVQTPVTKPTSTLPPLQQETYPFETPLFASRHSTTGVPSPTSSPTATATAGIPTHPPNNILHAPTPPQSSSPNPHPNPFTNLSSAAKAGIITGLSILFLTIFLILLEMCFLRKKRRERALRRAVEEVERGGGLEMSKNFGPMEGSWLGKSVGRSEVRGVSESKENMVMESRVEILVVDGIEDDGEGFWDGVWEADEEDIDGDMEDEGMGRGRMAMSLPRRVY